MNRIKAYILFIGLFFLIFPPHVLISGFTFKSVYLFVFVPSVFGAYDYSIKRNKSNVIKITLALMAVAFIYFSLISGLVHFADTGILGEIITGIILLFSCYFYVNAYHEFYGRNCVSNLFVDLNRAGVIQALIVIATFVSSGFRDFLYSFIGVTETSSRYLFGEVPFKRFQGIAPSGFSFLSTTHALLLVCGIWGFYINNKKYSGVEIFFFTLGQIAILISILLIGRTGLIVTIIFTASLAMYTLFSSLANYCKPNKINITNSIKVLISLLFILCIFAMTFDFSEYEKNIEFAFETVIKYYKYRELDSSSTSVINDHYILPSTTYEILFGTGNFGRSESLPYVESDVGYILFIFGSGIIGIVIGFSFYFAGLYYSIKYRKLNSYLSLFILTYLAMLAIVNLKDYYYLSHVGYTQVYFIMLCALAISIEHRRTEQTDVVNIL